MDQPIAEWLELHFTEEDSRLLLESADKVAAILGNGYDKWDVLRGYHRLFISPLVPVGGICPNCDTGLPEGCGGLWKGDPDCPLTTKGA